MFYRWTLRRVKVARSYKSAPDSRFGLLQVGIIKTKARVVVAVTRMCHGIAMDFARDAGRKDHVVSNTIVPQISRGGIRIEIWKDCFGTDWRARPRGMVGQVRNSPTHDLKSRHRLHQ